MKKYNKKIKINFFNIMQYTWAFTVVLILILIRYGSKNSFLNFVLDFGIFGCSYIFIKDIIKDIKKKRR